MFGDHFAPCRREAWISAGLMDTLQGLVLGAYDRIIGLQLSAVAAIDGCITKAMDVAANKRQKPGRSRKRGHQAFDGGRRRRYPLRALTAPADRHGPTLRRLLRYLAAVFSFSACSPLAGTDLLKELSTFYVRCILYRERHLARSH